MQDISIQLIKPSGLPLGSLRLGALALIAEAENIARTRNLSKKSAIPILLSECLMEVGCTIAQSDLDSAVSELERIRAGEVLPVVRVSVMPLDNNVAKNQALGASNGSRSGGVTQKMGRGKAALIDNKFFEAVRTYPDLEAERVYECLVGLDEHKERLLIELEMLLYPDKVAAWSHEHHDRLLRLCELQQNRIPLILLEGDVGTGKTALAESIGSALVRQMEDTSKVHLLKINTQIRGSGLVGEMSDLIVQAFSQAESYAETLGGDPVLVLLDEADALATRRDSQQMHHEDKAGLNTILQRLDNLRFRQLPIAVMFITNRPDALDPAVRRRAALDLVFERPSDAIRIQIVQTFVPELQLRSEEMQSLVYLTGEDAAKNKGVRFTASDITDRLLTGALRTAYRANKPLEVEDILQQASLLEPTPPMQNLSV